MSTITAAPANTADTRPCPCPSAGVSSTLGAVNAYGHDETCTAPAPLAYMWLADWKNPESVRFGSLKDYARAWRDAYLGNAAQVSTEVQTWNSRAEVELTVQGISDDGCITYRLTVGGESAEVEICASATS